MLVGEGFTFPKEKVLKITFSIPTENNFDVLQSMTEGHIQISKGLSF